MRWEEDFRVWQKHNRRGGQAEREIHFEGGLLVGWATSMHGRLGRGHLATCLVEATRHGHRLAGSRAARCAQDLQQPHFFTILAYLSSAAAAPMPLAAAGCWPAWPSLA